MGFNVANMRKFGNSPIRSYRVPEIEYVKQGVEGKKSVMSLGKIMSAYGKYLKELENFSVSHKSDYAATMAINYLKIKNHKSYLKKCYNKYKLNKENFAEVVKIANEFRGSYNSGNQATFISFFQAIMRIKLPLSEVDKALNKDKKLLGYIFLNRNISDSAKKSIVAPQNEFFKYADKSKISPNIDKQFITNFQNLYRLSRIIPEAANRSINDLLEDLTLICEKKFQLKKKNKVESQTEKNSDANEEKIFVRNFINKIEGIEKSVEKILDEYELEKKYLNKNQLSEFLNKFDLSEPHILYKKLTNLEECKKFLQNRKGKNITRVEEYFASVYEYLKAIMEVKGEKKSKALKLVKNVEKDYKKFSSKSMKVIDDPKKLKKWNKNYK